MTETLRFVAKKVGKWPDLNSKVGKKWPSLWARFCIKSGLKWPFLYKNVPTYLHLWPKMPTFPLFSLNFIKRKILYRKVLFWPKKWVWSFAHAFNTPNIIEGIECGRQNHHYFLFVRMWSMLESKFQSELIAEIKELFPGAIVLKNDPNYLQGFPDLLILYKNKWASLEVKRSSTASRQANQEYYVDLLNDMSYSAFVFPENKEGILNDLQYTFRSRR